MYKQKASLTGFPA